MAQFIHLFDARHERSIRRGGIRVRRTKWRLDNGVFAHPQTENPILNHQWMRELRRRQGLQLLAARLRIPDTELVRVGKYNATKLVLTAAAAIGVVREHSDPLGLEVIIPRAIAPHEILAIYRPPKVTGWRFYPAARGRKPCGCEYCQRGEPFSRRLRTD
ncbi:MAG: hypothetical protein KDI37_11370 [Xanthomonadales bacterium]|nr:hypothetical protein [Xanthomonadales bacterium]MCB1642324.1 hypothetical protein [Xanthomonadales bacterium]